MNKWLRIPAGLLGAVVGYYAVRGGCSGSGPSVSDLKRYTSAGVSAEFPGQPQPMNLDLPIDARVKVSTIENFHVPKKNFEAMVSRIVGTPGTEANADSAINGALSNLVNNQKMTKVSEERKPITLSGVGGFRYTAVFRKEGTNVEMQGVVLAKGPTIWQVFAVYLKDSSRSRDVANRMVGSVQLAN